MRYQLLMAAFVAASMGGFIWGPQLAFGATRDKAAEPTVAVETFTVPHYDLLALDDTIKGMLDREIRPLPRKHQRLTALHALLYSPQGQHIQYQASGNHSARDTYYKKSGNCIALANLFIAAARYVGLDAHYQFVEVSPQWRPHGEFFQVPGHINAVVNIHGQHAIIEFNGAYFESLDGQQLRSKVISDQRAKAEFYNNLGVELLGQGKQHQAIAFFDYAISLDNTMDFTWSNRGVAYKHLGNYKEAERNYRKALTLNPRNNSAVKNTYILHKALGNVAAAKKLAKRVEKYARKNPYYLAKIADRHIATGDYKKAVKLLRKAIKIHDQEADFHHRLAVAYFNIEKYKKSRAELHEAKRLAASESKKIGFQEKIDALAARM